MALGIAKVFSVEVSSHLVIIELLENPHRKY